MNELAEKLLAWRTTILWVLMSLMAVSSFVEFSSPNSMDREVEKLEKTIHKRQSVLADYAARALQIPDTVLLIFLNFHLIWSFTDTVQTLSSRG